MFGSLSWYGTKFIFLDQSASMVLLTLMIHSVKLLLFRDMVHYQIVVLFCLLVHSIRLVLSNIMVHSLMVILSLDGVHSWKVALSLVMIHFIPCGTISFHDSLSECGTNWCQGSLKALVLTAVMVHSVNLSRFLCLIQFRSLVLFVLLFHCKGLVLSWPMVL